MTTRADIRQRALRTYGRGWTGTSTATGSNATLVDDALQRFPNDWWIGGEIKLTSGTYKTATPRFITNFVSSTGTITFVPTIGGNSGNTTTYEIVKGLGWASWNDLLTEAVERVTEIAPVPYINEALTLDSTIYEYRLPYAISQTALTASSNGTTTTVIDTALTETDNFWNGGLIIITSGNAEGDIRRVEDFDADADTLMVERPFSAAPQSADTFDLHRFFPYSIHHLQYYDSGSKWQDIPDASWTIDRAGDWSTIRFYNKEQIGLQSRLWTIQDERILRILGTRLPITPDDDNDPIEVPAALLSAWLRYLYHDSSAASSGTDPTDHARRLTTVRDEIARLEASLARGWPPNSRLV